MGREADAAAGVFVGGGEMGALCRAKDWSATALGPVAEWPQSLRTAAGATIASAFANIVCWGPELIQIYNDGYIPISGVKHPWALGLPTREVWPEVWHLNGPLFEAALGGETVYVEDAPYELSRRGPDQPAEATHFSLSFSPIPAEGGTVGGVLVTAFETTREVESRRVQAERDRLLRDLQVERARLGEVFRQAPSFLAILRGPEHVLELVNDAYLQLVGHREVVGLPILDALPEIRGQGFRELLDGVLETGVPFIGREVPVMVVRTPGADPEERFLDLVYKPLVESDGTRSGVVAHGTDITEHVRARAEVEAARAEAEQANRAKTQFLANMSHELRTPLNAIAGYTELLEMGIRGAITPEQRSDLVRIQKSQKHLLGLVNEVLNYARIETGAVLYEIVEVDLREAIAEVEPLVAPLVASKGLTLALGAPDAPCVARADADKVRQVLLNLLSNAIKFTRPGGAIEIGCALAIDHVFVRVRDTGIGIPAEKLEAVFEPFVQVNAELTRTQEGTGLGLAISRDLARGMGGDLTAESSAGAGSVFTLSLPRA